MKFCFVSNSKLQVDFVVKQVAFIRLDLVVFNPPGDGPGSLNFVKA